MVFGPSCFTFSESLARYLLNISSQVGGVTPRRLYSAWSIPCRSIGVVFPALDSSINLALRFRTSSITLKYCFALSVRLYGSTGCPECCRVLCFLCRKLYLDSCEAAATRISQRSPGLSRCLALPYEKRARILRHEKGRVQVCSTYLGSLLNLLRCIL